MDPLTHTLVGASLAQTRFGRVPLGTTTLVVGANLPDVDAATYFIGSDLALLVRRGWTHGILAMAVLPLVLGWAMHLVDRIRCRRNSDATPVPVRRLIALSYLSVLSHPAMDWLNTYGVRLLMPFSREWFYGAPKIVIDAMGGDHAPGEIVSGTLAAAKEIALQEIAQKIKEVENK